MSVNDWRQVSYHGLMHTGIVNMVREHGVPAPNPLIAWQDLHYPYGVHIVIAALTKYFSVTATGFFAALNVICIVLYATLVDRIANHVWNDRSYRMLAVVLSIIGSAFLLGLPLAQAFDGIGLVPFDGRLDPIHKFMTINANQLGLVLFAALYLCLVRIAEDTVNPRTGFIYLTLCAVAVGFFYPLAWLGCMLTAMAAVGAHLSVRRRDWRAIIAIVAASVIATALLIPWFLTISDQSSGTTIAPTLENIIRNGSILVATLAVPGLLVWWDRAALLERLAGQTTLIRFLILSMGLLMLGFVLIGMPANSEYKLLLMSLLPLGLLFASALSDLLRTRRLLACALLWLICLPYVYRFGPILIHGWPTADQTVAEGSMLQPRDPAEAALYEWLRQETPVDAAVIDTWLTVPPFADRALFVGLDQRREDGSLRWPGEGGDRKDGWTSDPRLLAVEAFGGDLEMYARRRDIATRLLTAGADATNPDMWHDLKTEIDNRSLYVVARDPAVATTLAQNFHLEAVFSNHAATVFRVRP